MLCHHSCQILKPSVRFFFKEAGSQQVLFYSTWECAKSNIYFTHIQLKVGAEICEVTTVTAFCILLHTTGQ